MQPTLNPNAKSILHTTASAAANAKKNAKKNAENADDSMIGDVLLVNKSRRAQSGDVIVLRDPRDPNNRLGKRLIATGRQWVSVPKWTVSKQTFVFDREFTYIPEGYIWVEGDNLMVKELLIFCVFVCLFFSMEKNGKRRGFRI